MTAQANEVPEDLLYSSEHEWLRQEGDLARVGITAFAQDRLGDVVYVELPAPGTAVGFMAKLGEIESVKVASELFSPLTGEVVEVNAALEKEPELVNTDPYGAGWLLVVRLSDRSELEKLLTPAAYTTQIEREAGL